MELIRWQVDSAQLVGKSSLAFGRRLDADMIVYR
jgi:hypothetical protein